MKLIKTINPAGVDESDIAGWEYRKAVRAVIFDNKNRVGLLRVKNQKYYKLPGGGIEKDENTRIALDRECEEELGIGIEVAKEIGSIEEYRTQSKLHQISYCFLARVSSEKNTPNFTDEEKSSGFEVTWVEPKDALKLLHLKQTSDYEGKFIEERDYCFLTKALEDLTRSGSGKW